MLIPSRPDDADARSADGGAPFEHVELEVAAISSRVLPQAVPDLPRPDDGRRIILVAIGEPDTRAYVCDGVRRRQDLAVLDVGSVAAALDAAERRRPALLIVGPSEAVLLRHLPAIPAVLLADDVPPAEPGAARRPAALVVLRGPFRLQRLLGVVGLLLDGGVPPTR